MSHRKFYIAFLTLASLVFITLMIFAAIVALPALQKMLGINEEQNKITLDKPLYNSSNPVLGPQNAKLKIVEFCDFLCPFCKQTTEEIQKLAKDYPDDVQVIWKNFPNTDLHPAASIAAIAGQCANEQGRFWEYHDLIFDNQNNLVGDHVGPLLLNFADELELDRLSFARCLASTENLDLLSHDFEEGRALGITGTPYLFINDVIKIDGGVEYGELEEYLK